MTPQGFIKIGERTFSSDDQINFSRLSGDCNPIHVDQVEARKTTNGKCIVHGINGLLWALECLCCACGTVPAKFEMKFQKLISIDGRVNCFWDKLKHNVKIETEENETLFSLNYERLSGEHKKTANVPIILKNRLKSP